MPPTTHIIRCLAGAITLGLALSASAQSLLVRQDVDQGAISAPHATKAVVGRSNTLHVVFVEDDQIFHTFYPRTPGSSLWSAPLQISTGQSATSPAIAVNALGDLAVVYVNNPDVNGLGELHYSYNYASSGWTPPVRIYTPLASQPAIAGYGRDVHLTFVDQSVFYARFQLDFPPPPLTAPALETVTFGFGVEYSRPSVAVARRDRCNRQPPIVRISYFSVDSTGPTTSTIQADLVDRLSSGTWWPVYSAGSSGPAVANVPISSSLAANRRTADFYFAYSFHAATGGGTYVNELARVDRAGLSNVINPFNTTTPLLVRVAAAQSSCSRDVRVSWAEVLPGPVFYQPTWSLAGQWPLGAGASLSNLTSDGRDPQPVFWSSCPAGVMTRIGNIFENESQVAPRYDLLNDRMISGCDPWQLCLDPAQLCVDTMINIASHLRIAGGGFGLPGEVGEVAITVENDATEPFEDLITLDVELPAGVELVGIEGEEWLCEATEGRMACFSRLETLDPGVTSELTLALKSTGEHPGDGCSKETPCDQLCVLVEPEEDDNPEDNRACLSLGSVK